jgi:hypothetical protein
MASLSGQKIKDKYDLLLKLESAQASATEQVVEDGAGNDTALKLSTDTLETTGKLKIPTTTATSNTDVSALMMDSNGEVVLRNLSTNAIGGSAITASSPLATATVAGTTDVSVVDAGTLNPLTSTTLATADKFLVWDETSSAYLYVDAANLSTFVGNNLGGDSGGTNQSTLLLRLAASQSVPVSTTPTAATTLVEYTAASETRNDTAATGDTRKFGNTVNSDFTIQATGSASNQVVLRTSDVNCFEFEAVIEFDESDVHTDLYAQIRIAGVTIAESKITAAIRNLLGEKQLIVRGFYGPASSTNRLLTLTVGSSTGNATINGGYFKVTNVGVPVA